MNDPAPHARASRPAPRPHARPKRPSAAWGMASVLLCVVVAAAARADSVRVHQRATAAGRGVKLRDIASLRGSYAQQLADTPIARFKDGRRSLTLRLSQVREALSAKGVNWGRLSLSGFTRCAVTRPTPDPSAAAASDAPGSAKAGGRGPSHAKASSDASAVKALRRRVMSVIRGLVGDSGGHLVVTFSDRDAGRLRAATPGARYAVKPMSTTGVGRVPLTIERYVHGTVADTFMIHPKVRVRIKAVVASGAISRGRRFTESNTKLAQVLLDTDQGTPVTDPDQVRGQVASSLLRAGAVVYPDNVAPPVLVKRGQLVTVRAIVGQMVIRTVARATEDGSRGQKITLRNEKTRKTFTATVSGPREAAI